MTPGYPSTANLSGFDQVGKVGAVSSARTARTAWSSWRLRRRAVALLCELAPVPLDMPVLVELLGERLGVVFDLVPLKFSDEPGRLSGMWVPPDKNSELPVHSIFYPKNRDKVWQLRSVAHEVSHVLLRHIPSVKISNERLMEVFGPRLLLEGTSMVCLHRDSYGTPDEAAAEALGTLLVARILAKQPVGGAGEPGRIRDSMR